MAWVWLLLVVPVTILPSPVCNSQGFNIIYNNKKIFQIPRLVGGGKSHHLIKLPLPRYRDGARVPSSESPQREEIAISAAGTLRGKEN